MANPRAQLETLFHVGSFAGLPGGTLLERFTGGPADVAEAAFTALVLRHSAMVRRTCQQVIGDYHEAEDASQATFLVLAHSARSVRSSESLAAWLQGVACRVSARAIANAGRRRARERRSAERAAGATTRYESWFEVHEELARLPERYRLPIVLCYLEGLSHVEAAHQLGCPVRTLQRRLAHGGLAGDQPGTRHEPRGCHHRPDRPRGGSRTPARYWASGDSTCRRTPRDGSASRMSPPTRRAGSMSARVAWSGPARSVRRR